MGSAEIESLVQPVEAAVVESSAPHELVLMEAFWDTLYPVLEGYAKTNSDTSPNATDERFTREKLEEFFDFPGFQAALRAPRERIRPNPPTPLREGEWLRQTEFNGGGKGIAGSGEGSIDARLERGNSLAHERSQFVSATYSLHGGTEMLRVSHTVGGLTDQVQVMFLPGGRHEILAESPLIGREGTPHRGVTALFQEGTPGKIVARDVKPRRTR